MIRVTIDLLPGGNVRLARTIGQIDIAHIGLSEDNHGSYTVVLKKSPPFAGALKTAWKKGVYDGKTEDEEVLQGRVDGHHRTRRGVYDLLYSALRACGMEARQSGITFRD